jgi:hypothetical protein
MTWKPFHFVVVAIAGWMNRQQQEVIEYLRTENQVLREKLGHQRLILNESQKVRPSWGYWLPQRSACHPTAGLLSEHPHLLHQVRLSRA